MTKTDCSPRNTLKMAVLVATVSLFGSNIEGAYASEALKSEMQEMFGTMSNTSAPGVFETNRRGVLSGGSIVTRNRIMNTNIVSFTPPSYNAGCGGLDLFGGSFSFINKDQMVALLRSVASNSLTFAFQIALEQMSSPIRSVMSKIQETIQNMNEHLGNSCQIAQGLVNDTRAAFDKKRDTEAGLVNSLVAGFSDTFEAFTSSSGEEPAEAMPEEHKEKIVGNIVWEALTERNVDQWLVSGNEQLNEIIMSASGSVIVQERAESPDGKGKSSPYTPLASIIKLQDLIEGGHVDFYACDDDKCLEPTVVSEQEFTGFEKMFLDTMTGTGTSLGGIIGKMRTNTGLNSDQQNFIANLPDSSGSLIFRLTRINPDLAKQFVIEFSKPMARDYAYDLIRSFMEAALAVTRVEQSMADATEAEAQILMAMEEMRNDYAAMVAKGPNVSDMVTKYNAILSAADKIIDPPSVPVKSN